MYKKIFLMLLLLVTLTGCGTTKKTSDIYTTIYPIEFLTQEIVGDKLTVSSVYPPGSDIHSYELSTQDILNITNSDLYISLSQSTNGGTSEKDINTLNLYSDLENEHVWLSPKQAKIMTDIIYKKMCIMYPEYKTEFELNYNDVISELNEIDKKYEKFALDQKSDIITSHEIFYWLSQDYKIQEIGLEGDDHHSEPSAREITQIVEYIKENNIEVIYAEQNDQNNALIKQIANDTNIEVLIIDNISSEDKELGNYYDRLNTNIEILEGNNS